MRYQVLSGTKEEIESAANDLIEYGYLPVGTVSIAEGSIYTQAFYKPMNG